MDFQLGNHKYHFWRLFSRTHAKLGPRGGGVRAMVWTGTATKAKQRWRGTEIITKNGIHL